MKFRTLSLCLLAGLFCCNAFAQDKDIVILYENDAHGALDGYVKLAGLYDAIAKADTAYVGMVCVGDFVYGGKDNGLQSGKNVMEIMNAMPYDAVEIGNHEFDIDTETLLGLLSKFKAPVLCGNLTDTEGNHLLPTITYVRYGSKKIAYIGMLTPMGMMIQRSSFYNGKDKIYDLHDEDYIVENLQKAADTAREQKADYVIMLAHIGEKFGGLSPKLIARTSGIDAVLDGHSHSVIGQQMVENKDGKAIPLTQTGIKFANIGKLVITADGRISTELIPISELEAYSNAGVKAIVEGIAQ